MGVTFPLQFPPATKVAGSPGFMTDINEAYNALQALAGVNVCDSQWTGGADPTGTVASDSAFNAAVAGLPVSGGVVFVPPGTYRLNTGVTVTLGAGAGPVQFFLSPGAVINYYGAGDCFRMHSSVAASPTGWRSGIIGGGLIDGTNAGAGASGIHVGDIPGLRLDCSISHFNGAGSIGLHLDNTVTWTEEADVRVILQYNTQQVVYEVTTGYSSFDYGHWDYTILANPGQDGVIIKAGADLYSTARLRIRGNFYTSASAFTNYVLSVSGTAPGGSQQSGHASALRGNLDIQVETDGGLANTHVPILVASGNLINCFGKIWLLGFTATSSLGAAGVFFFGGSLFGDSVLNASATACVRNFGSSTVFPPPLVAITIPNLPTQQADFFSFTLSASITISLTAGNPAVAGPQRKTIIIKQAAAGNFTVTWPHAGSPTTSSPTVLWPGGTAPTMTATANAVDMYELSTYDGATWIGRATQNVS